MFNYLDSKANIINILKSKTPIEECETVPADQEFTFKNGITCFVSSIFVDIKNSSELFKTRDVKLARLLRAFTSEIIGILCENSNFNQIGIRGDCVYAIYSTPMKDDVKSVFDCAVYINTFMIMFNKLLVENGYEEITVGIGLGCDKELIIKAGRSHTGINDKIWIGDAVVDASNLSSVANRHGYEEIAMSDVFYQNIKGYYQEHSDWFSKISNSIYYDGVFYQCSLVKKEFYDWIKAGMKEDI